MELFEGASNSGFDDRTSYLSTFPKRVAHPRPPPTANLDMRNSGAEWDLTNKFLPSERNTANKMPVHNMVYQRHQLPVRTMSSVQLTHDPESPSATAEMQAMYRTTNSTYRDDNGNNVRQRLNTGENINTRCNWARTSSKVKIGGGSAETVPGGTVSMTHARHTHTDFPQQHYYEAANGYGRHPPPLHHPTVDLSHDENAAIFGGKGNGGQDYIIPPRPYADIGVTQEAGEGFSTHNQGTYGNPGKAALKHALMPKEHVRGKGEWRMLHNESGVDMEAIGAAALRLASSKDTTNAGYQNATARLAEQVRTSGVPIKPVKRLNWDRTAATVPMKGGDGHDDKVAPHYSMVHTGAQNEAKTQVFGIGKVDRLKSTVMMKSPAMGTKDATETSKYSADFNEEGYSIQPKAKLPVRNTSTVPIKTKAGADYHKGVSDYHATFAKPKRSDYQRRLNTVGFGTASKLPLTHDAQTIW